MTVEEKKQALKDYYRSQKISLHRLLEDLILKQKVKKFPRIYMAVEAMYQELVDQGKLKAN